jgi:hypothetical protein
MREYGFGLRIGVGAVGGERAHAPRGYAMTRWRRTESRRPAASRHADSSLGLPGCETACAQPRSDQRFITSKAAANLSYLDYAVLSLLGRHRR